MAIMLNKPLLRITRGKTQYPLRAIDAEQFLIGAGNCCQLQLSSGEIPMIYAMLKSTDQGCQIEAFHAHPTLIINGAPQRSAHLQTGDRIRFGAYEFEFLIEQVEHELRTVDSTTALPLATEVKSPMFISELPAQLESLSASDLVDRIAQELELLEQFADYDDLPDDFLRSQIIQDASRKTA